MSGEKSGENRLFQIVMVLITSVVAPLIVFFVTNSAKNSSPAPTATSSIAITATIPANNQPTVVANAQATASQSTAAPTTVAPTTAVSGQPAANPESIQNPTGLVPAGTAAIVDNLSLTVSPEDVAFDGPAIRVTLHIKNLGADARTVTLTAGSVTVKDDKKTYSQMMGDKKSGCDKADLTLNKTITAKPGADTTVASATEKQPGTWCAPDQNTIIPAFAGPLSKDTTKLQVQINGVGPFKGFTFVVPIKK